MKTSQKLEEIKFFIEKANLSNCDGWQMSRFVPNADILFLCGYKKKFRVKCFLAFCNVTFIDLPKKLTKSQFRFELDEILNKTESDLITFIEGNENLGIVRSKAIYFIDREKDPSNEK